MSPEQLESFLSKVEPCYCPVGERLYNQLIEHKGYRFCVLELRVNEPPEIDITGKWRDTQGTGFMTWDEGHLRQEQNKVTGVIGDYNVIGVVSGKIVYLAFLHHGRVYYTARLEMSQNLLTGNYFKARDKEQKKGYPTSFVKIVEPTKK